MLWRSIFAIAPGRAYKVAGTKDHEVNMVNCPNVPDYILDPKKTWADAESYAAAANNLALAFVKNLEKLPIIILPK
ncbi:MAG: Phosphoenolpyruvate carboxykinase [Mucilaginibacter sp.]|nr:Phosphoenolpyruvate carboxykinase [Mucilaginibacter sp.]